VKELHEKVDLPTQILNQYNQWEQAMWKLWMKGIGTLTLVFVIAAFAGSCNLVGASNRTTPTHHDFPLSEEWATQLRGKVEHITIDNTNTIFARTSSDIYAVDMQSGSILWRQRITRDLLYSPVLAEQGMIFFADGRGLLALRSSDGEILWQQFLRRPSSARVVDVTPDLVAVNDPSFISVYQTHNGSLLWEKSVCREQVQAYFYDAHIVVPCFGLTALDALSGEVVWETQSDKGLDRIWKSAYANGVIYSSQDLKYITAYDVKNRRQLWKKRWENDRSQAFRVSGDYLLAMKDDQICILHRSDGEISWCASNLDGVKDPVIFGDVLYLFYGFKKGIIAYDLEEGSKIGRLDFPGSIYIADDYHTQLIIPSDEFLIFAYGNKIYAYKK
jgi:outer membrane protein assembly factor BamB